jgi:hypothetical protein
MIMADSRKTDERLRSWLDSNQMQRERLCAHLLPLLGPYSNIEPRRPRGGPDVARDLQAVYDGQLEVWGAVGFLNSANDDRTHKTRIKKKFRSDLDSALEQNPALKGFVFLTNVDLTPGEQDRLKQTARDKGIVHVEIFNRERLRLKLDDVEGWGYRLQFLEIGMTKEEQLAFIERFGARLESLFDRQRTELNERQKGIDEKLRRIEFLHDCDKPTRWARFFIFLRQPIMPEHLGHFRVALQLSMPFGDNASPTVWLCACDGYGRAFLEGVETLLWGFQEFAWSRKPEHKLADGVRHVFSRTTQVIDVSVQSNIREQYPTMADFDRVRTSFYVTQNLVPHIATVGFEVNNYQLACLTADRIGTLPKATSAQIEWPAALTPEENDEWIQIGHRIVAAKSQLGNHEQTGPIDMAFEAYTPHKAPPELRVM